MAQPYRSTYPIRPVSKCPQKLPNLKRRLTEPSNPSATKAIRASQPAKKYFSHISHLPKNNQKRVLKKKQWRRWTYPILPNAQPIGSTEFQRPTNYMRKLSEAPQDENRNDNNITVMFPGSFVEEFKCGSQGGVYNSHEHGIILLIPEGAIAIGEEITVEIGITLNGPFTFPSGMQPVSPILWLCVKEERFSGFMVPVTIRIPHCIECPNQESCNRLTLLKAAHKHTLEGAELSPKPKYHFQVLQESANDIQFNSLQNYGTFKTRHFCSLCIAAHYDESIKSSIQHCLFGAVCKKGQDMYIRFAVLYMLDTCIQCTKEVFNKLYGSEIYREISPKVFTFNGEHLEIMFERKLESGWTCALESSSQIRQCEVDFWQISADQLITMQSNYAYPPSFVIHATGGAENDILKIAFSGSKHDTGLTLEVLLSACSVSPGLQPASPEPYIHHYSRPCFASTNEGATPSSITSPSTPPPCTVLTDADLDQITSVVLKRLEWDWERVPRALEIPGDVIFETKYDVKGIRSQIFALLKYWREIHPANSKEKLDATLSKIQCLH